MSDLVERLREGVAFLPNITGGFSVDLSGTVTMMNEAADRITDLEAQVAAADRLADAAKATWDQACDNHDREPPVKYMAPYGGLVAIHTALAAYNASKEPKT